MGRTGVMTENQSVHSDYKLFDWENSLSFLRQKVGQFLNDAEWEYFLSLSRRHNLNHLLGEIWVIKKKPDRVANIFTGRDGLLKIAHHFGYFDGMKTVLLQDLEDIVEETDVLCSKAIMVGAKCYVWRKDMSQPVIASVRLDEYCKNKKFWIQKPETMIKKVAETHALKRAFVIDEGLLMDEFQDFFKHDEDMEMKNDLNDQTWREQVKKEPIQGAKSLLFEELSEEVQHNISNNTQALFTKIAYLSGKDLYLIKQNILSKYGATSIKEMRYTDLRVLYKDLLERMRSFL